MLSSVQITPGAGENIAAEKLGGISWQVVKLVWGADGEVRNPALGSGNVTGDVLRVTLASNDAAVTALGLLARPTVDAVTGTLAALAAGTAFVPQRERPFNLTVWGTFVATWVLERSFDGVTWHPLTACGVPLYSLTGPASEMLEEPEAGVSYRVRVTAFTSGTLNYRLSQ